MSQSFNASVAISRTPNVGLPSLPNDDRGEGREEAGVSRDTVEREIQRGNLKAFRVGRRRRITVDSIRQLVARAA